MSTQTLGKVSITPKSTWDASTSYVILDVVNYNGSGYIARKASTNIAPTNEEYWLKIANKGDTGTAAGFGTPTASASSLPTGSTPTASVTASGEDTAKIFSFLFGIPAGATGNGIASITKTGTSGLVDTYTVTMTSGTTYTFTVTNGEDGDDGAAAGFGTPTASVDAAVGTPYVTITASGPDTAKIFDFAFHNMKGQTGNGIASVEKTGTSGNVDTYTITMTDGTTATFTVTNANVSSVNGETGAVVLDGSDINVDNTATTPQTIKAAITQQSSQIEELTEPHPYAYDGVDLKAYFGTATALHTALRAEDYSHINNGDYYPITFSGTYRDYGEWVALSGTSYYSDTACTQKVGELSEDTITTYDDASPAYYKVTVSGTSYYVKMQDCQRYREKTINSLAKMEANINPYWEYGDSGELSGKKPHICWIARDGITTAKFRSTNQQWTDAVEQFETGDGSTATYTPSDATLTRVRYVCVNGTLKTYNTHYTVNTSTGAVTFKTGSIPATGDAIIISRTTHDNPWVGSAIYKTLNDADYGLMRLIDDSTFASFILDSMRYYGETRSVANSTSGVWTNRGKGFLPTEPEVWGEVIYGIRNPSFLPQLPIFSGGRRHIMKGSSNGGSRSSWWVASSTSLVDICYVYYGGRATNTNARLATSLVPGFVSC